MSDDSESELSPMSLLRLPPSRGSTRANDRARETVRGCDVERAPQAFERTIIAHMLAPERPEIESAVEAPNITHLLTNENAVRKIERDTNTARRIWKLFGKK